MNVIVQNQVIETMSNNVLYYSKLIREGWVRFLEISGEDRKVIAKAVMEHLKASKEEIDPMQLQKLETLVIEPEQVEAVTK